ncbi:SIMPL domain-containing protein [Candidatus Woesearchaeota archaeon]|nr:SIMPL domain-containing protein [Candidatus Woesearchaeota archaeon]
MKEEQPKQGRAMLLTLVLAVGLILVSSLFALNSNKITTSSIQQQTVTVSETVEKEAMPDKAEVYVEIQTDADTAQDAKNKNAEISTAVLAALKASGISDDNIETSSYYLNEKTKWDDKNQVYLNVGYTLTNIVKVTTEEVNSAGSIIDTAVNAGATGINNVDFTLTHDKEMKIKEQALAEAAAKAKDKAKVLADAVDTSLGDLVTMTESSYSNWPRPWLYGQEMKAVEMVSSAETSVSPQQLTVSATVTLTYEIEE